ncbi:MAG: TIGR03936 family radical SAM-associated protein [Lachnospiraceae bacterium]|nr:TIGR03936 family radical SAM-associated protein [Lachnospiraceae bacterium]
MSVVARFCFARKGPVCYIGHLDMLRYFQKAVMRSGIPAKYSEGFHPHQLMSFAYPLGVAMETEGDYMDLELTEELPEEELKERMNAVMKEGVSIRKVTLLKEGAPNAMSLVALADYRLETDVEETELKRAVSELLAETELLVGAEARPSKDGRKKKEKKPKDIRPGILELRAEGEGCLFMKLLSGSAMNVRPADVFSLLCEKLGREAELLRLVRLEIYGAEDSAYKPLSEMGAAASTAAEA